MTLDLNDPIALLLAVVDGLSAAGLRSAVYGGLALAVYGEARETRDADVAVVGVNASQGVDALRSLGVQVSATFDRVRFGGHMVSRIALVSGGDLNTADLVEPRSARYAVEALDRAMPGALRGHDLSVLAPEDFILFKILSTRDRDLEDARTVLRAVGDQIDTRFLDEEATALAAEVPDHDVLGRLAAVRTVG